MVIEARRAFGIRNDPSPTALTWSLVRIQVI